MKLNSITEVTGMPGSGKSTWIKKNIYNDLNFSDKETNTNIIYKKLLFSFSEIVKLILRCDLSTIQLKWLINQMINYDESIPFRINALRNALLKFNQDIKLQENHNIIIDEGVSHIPFIFQLERKSIIEFLELFHQILYEREILYLIPPPKDIIINRLLKRGHKRAKGREKIKQLVDVNTIVCNNYSQLLQESDLNVEFIYEVNKLYDRTI